VIYHPLLRSLTTPALSLSKGHRRAARGDSEPRPEVWEVSAIGLPYPRYPAALRLRSGQAWEPPLLSFDRSGWTL